MLQLSKPFPQKLTSTNGCSKSVLIIRVCNWFYRRSVVHVAYFMPGQYISHIYIGIDKLHMCT